MKKTMVARIIRNKYY